MEQTGRNESEPHQMSLEKSKTGDKPSPYPWGEGRREQAAQQSEPAQRSGGVSVDSTSGSQVRVRRNASPEKSESLIVALICIISKGARSQGGTLTQSKEAKRRTRGWPGQPG